MPLLRFGKKPTLKFVLAGITYTSMKEICRAYDIEFNTVKYRIKKGWSLEEAIGIKNKTYNTIVLNGIGFKSLASACKKFNLPFNTVKYRLEKGWTLEEAFGVNKRKHEDFCNGYLYVITNLVNENKYIGITAHKTIQHRLKQHLACSAKGSNTKLHRAIREIGEQNFVISLLKQTHSKNELRNLEIKYIKKYNSIVKGYNSCKGGGYLGDRSGNNVVYEGIHYQSVTALAKKFNISSRTVQYRLDHNIDMSLPVVVSKAVKYKGVVYSSIIQLCKKFNISRTVANYRLIHNIPFENPVRTRS